MKTSILMVDDDEEICEEMGEILVEEGYAVEAAHNGLDAKKLIERNEYDIILLDLKMPGLNGFEVLKFVKGLQRKSKVIVITGRLMDEKYLPGKDIFTRDEKAGIIQLADGFVNKPFDVRTLLDSIGKFAAQS